MQAEEWRACIGFPSYSVSSLGRVQRTSAGLQKWSVAGKILAHDINKDGHHRVTLFEAGTRTKRFVHQLICEAWRGPAPSSDHMVCHSDDVKSNNDPGNLYWGTRKDNGADSVKNGRSVRGAHINTARLNESQIIEIREKASRGFNNCMLAREFGVPDTQISEIVRGLAWKHVGGPTRETRHRGTFDRAENRLASGEIWVDGLGVGK